MEARIPFGGFYESMWSQSIEDEETQYAEELEQEHDVPLTKVNDILWHHTKYHLAYAQVAREYVPSFSVFMDVPMSYNEMTSPREYNFETDKIFVTVEYKDMLRLARRVGRNALRKAAKAMFTSRDGFCSFYSPRLAEWGPLRTWDHNQLYCLLAAAVYEIGGDDWEWSIYEDFNCNGTFSNAYYAATDTAAINFELGKLVGEQELRKELEESDDGKRFPVAWSDTQDYVTRYHTMNSNGLAQGGI